MRHRRTYQALTALLLAVAPVARATTASATIPLPESGCRASEAVSTELGGNVLIKAGWVTDDLGTGEQNGVPDPYTAQDTKWTVVAPAAGPAYSVSPHSAWVTVPDANWINTSTTYASHGSSGPLGPVEDTLNAALAPLVPVTLGPSGLLAGTATFRTEFTLPNRFQQAVLDLEFAADNGVTFRLNGTPIGGYDTGSATSTAFNQMHPLTYVGPLLHSGTNVLDAVVTDYGVATGLLVRGTAKACELLVVGPGTCMSVEGQHVVLYSPAPIDVGTGSHNNVPDALHTHDSKWFYGTQGAFSIPTNGAWYGLSTTNNWVNWRDTDFSSGVTPRTYTLTFTLPAGTTWVDLDLRFAADNGVTFRLNGVPVGGFGSGGSDPSAFKQLHPLHVTDVTSVVAGLNTLEAVVTDLGGYTGLLVEGSLSACRAHVGPSSVA